MNILIPAAIIVAMLSSLMTMLIRNDKTKVQADRKSRIIPYVMVADMMLITADMMAGGNVVARLPVDMLLCMVPMLMLNSSVLDMDVSYKASSISVCAVLCLTGYYVLVSAGIVPLWSDRISVLSALFLSIVLCLSYQVAIYRHVDDVHAVMKSGGVWTNLSYDVDLFHLLVINAYMMLMAFMCISVGSYDGVHVYVVTALLGAEMAALSMREAFASLFVVRHRQERRIVESMRISQLELPNDGITCDNSYQEIYERVVAYFESEKPYLNSELTINDLVKVVYSNKLYISRAISQYTGRNFCQFVNYYRIRYSVELFRENPELKVLEVASMCGFNSVVSFNMAFRLYMNENPSEWMRKERNRQLKRRGQTLK